MDDERLPQFSDLLAKAFLGFAFGMLALCFAGMALAYVAHPT